MTSRQDALDIMDAQDRIYDDMDNVIDRIKIQAISAILRAVLKEILGDYEPGYAREIARENFMACKYIEERAMKREEKV